MSNYSKKLSRIIDFSDEILGEASITRHPQKLYDPINYMFTYRGKQIRSVFSLLSHDMFGGNIHDFKEFILSIESLHTFTLMHDDVMDNANIRRGVQSVNKKWSNNQSILSGDALLVKSYEYLCLWKLTNKLILQSFTDTAIKVCEGQQLDLDFSDQEEISLDEYFGMIELKTSALIQLALVVPTLLNSNLKNKNVDLMSRIGLLLGRLFQIQDDYLDLYGHELDFGKSIGRDVYEKKKTALYVRALVCANEQDRKRLKAIYNSNDPHKLEVINQIYAQFQVKEYTEDLIRALYQDILSLISQIGVPEKNKSTFLEFLDIILNRNS
tara:strand:- start:4959 stop:5936 length:978 start_codon:yes stop_codon:yes gene_type:complete